MSVFSTTLSYGFPHALAKTARPLAFAIASLCLNAFSFGQNTIFITSPANGSNADHNTDLSVNVSYQTGGGGYQTPTWAYKIDSSFPTSYQSAHGGIQVTGQTTVNDFLVGQANGMRNVHVALLDQAGNLLNPTATASVQVNYQSGGGNYQSGGDNYQSGSSGNQSQGGGDQILVLSPGNGTHVDPHNDNILVGVNFATGGGSYQTPTWAYKIDSPFPATYQSSHGGTLVYGHFEGNFMNNSQSFGQHTLYVTMLEQNGNLKNPPLGTQVSFNYQSGSGGYQSGAGGNQAQGGGDQIFIVSPGNGTAVDQHNDGLLVNVAYASAGGGYQTPKWAYKIDSPFPTSYQSSHGGTVVDGHYKPNFMNDAQNFGQHTVYVTLLEQNGNLRNPPLGAHVSFNYQSQQVDYQSGHNNYQSGQGNNQQIGFFDFTVRGNVDLNSSAALKALAANHQWIYFQVYMDDQNVSYDSAGEKVGNSIWALSIENATGGQPNMIVDMSGKVYHGDFASYWFRAHGIDTSNNSHWREMSYSTTSAGIDSLLMAHPVIHDPTALLHTIKPFDFMPDGQANLSSQSALLQLASGHAEIYFQKYHFPETTSAGTHSANQDAFLNPLEIISGQERYQSQAGDYQPGGGNYQSGGGNYQSGGGNYQSGGGGFVPYTGPYVSPTHDLRLDTRNALFDDHVENKGLNSVTKLKADYNTTKAFNDSIDALLVTLPTLAPPPSTAKGDAIDNWIKGEFEQVKTLDPKKETAFVWALSIEDSNSAGNIVIDMHGNLYNNTDYESYWLSVYGVPTHNDPNWSEVEYHMSSAGLAKLYQDHPFVDPNVVIESKYKMAVVETDDPQVHGSTLHLSGSLRDSNGTSIMQVGFLISSQGHPSVSDPNSQTISASNVNNLLTASYVVPSGGVYYVRTFAQTMAGYSEGPVRKVEVFLDDLSSSDPKVVALAMIREGTVELAGGWRQSSWFGLYLDHGNGWIYHQVHGWLYMIHDGQNGIWTWQQQRKWVWTSRELYPYLYQADTASWLYLLGIVNGQAVFFNYGSYQIEIR